MTTRYRPFSNGSQFGDWQERNCDKCWKHQTDDDKPVTCNIENGLFRALWDDGSVSKRIALRMGYLGETGEEGGYYTWDCPERESEDLRPGPPTEEKLLIAAGYTTLWSK